MNYTRSLQKTAHLLVNNSPKYKCKFRDMMVIREDSRIDFFQAKRLLDYKGVAVEHFKKISKKSIFDKTNF